MSVLYRFGNSADQQNLRKDGRCEFFTQSFQQWEKAGASQHTLVIKKDRARYRQAHKRIILYIF